MQSLNDDMDELFRRASEEYPLKADGADWDKVMQQLHAPEEPVIENKKQRDYKFLWLLLLLPIGFVCGRYFNSTSYPTPKQIVKQKAGTIETAQTRRHTADKNIAEPAL